MKSATFSALHSFVGASASLEDEPRLQLKHSRRVDVCERGNRVRCRADSAHELAECGCRCCGVTIGRDPASEEVPVIEKIKAFEPQQYRRAFRQFDPILDKDRYLG